MTKNRVYTTDICEMFWDKRGFIRINLLESQSAYNLDEAQRQFDIAKEIVNGEK